MLIEAHEALMLLNVTEQPAHVLLDFYFEDKTPCWACLCSLVLSG